MIKRSIIAVIQAIALVACYSCAHAKNLHRNGGICECLITTVEARISPNSFFAGKMPEPTKVIVMLDQMNSILYIGSRQYDIEYMDDRRILLKNTIVNDAVEYEAGGRIDRMSGIGELYETFRDISTSSVNRFREHIGACHKSI